MHPQQEGAEEVEKPTLDAAKESERERAEMDGTSQNQFRSFGIGSAACPKEAQSCRSGQNTRRLWVPS